MSPSSRDGASEGGPKQSEKREDLPSGGPDPSASEDTTSRSEPERTLRVLAGRVVKPHGIHGEVVVAPLSDRPERFEPGALLYAEDRTMIVVSARPHQGRLLVRFSEVCDRTAAERLRGARLEADPLSYDEEPDTYLVSELVGMPVVSEDGRDLGVVEALVELPAAAEYDLLEIAPAAGQNWLLPAAEEYVAVECDDTGFERLVILSPPEGLVPHAFQEPGDPPLERETSPPPRPETSHQSGQFHV